MVDSELHGILGVAFEYDGFLVAKTWAIASVKDTDSAQDALHLSSLSRALSRSNQIWIICWPQDQYGPQSIESTFDTKLNALVLVKREPNDFSFYLGPESKTPVS